MKKERLKKICVCKGAQNLYTNKIQWDFKHPVSKMKIKSKEFMNRIFLKKFLENLDFLLA